MDKDNNVFWAGIALFLGSFFFCLFFINEGLFHVDSVVLAKAVEEVYKTGHLHPAVSGRYGIVIINSILYFPFYLLGQNADFSTRLSSVLFYSLSISAFFIFINVLFKDRIQGLFAAVLLALTPFYLIPNTYGKEHGMSMFFFLCSMVLVDRGVEGKRPLALVSASLCFMVALSVRESVLFMIPFYFWLYFRPAIAFKPFRINIQKERLNGRLLFSFLLPAVILFSFMMTVYLGPLIQKSINGDDFSVPHFCGFFSTKLPHAFMDIRYSFPDCFLFFGTLGAVILWKDRRYFLLFFSMLWACLIFLYGNFDGYAARYLDMVILAAHAVVSYFLAWLYRQFRALTIIIFASFLTIQFIHIYPLLEFRHHYDGTLRLASFIRTITPGNAVILTVDEGPFIEYYAKRATICYPIGHWEKLDSFIHEIERLMDRQIPVYVIPTSPHYLSGGIVTKSKFFEVGSNGSNILSQLIKEGILKDVSSTEVSFQLTNELKRNAIRKIAKGDFDKIWSILQQSYSQSNRKIVDRFKFSKAGDIFFEDYHHPELNMDVYMMPIFKAGYFGFTVDEFTDSMLASSLLKVIIHDLGIPVPDGKDDIEKLNNILKINELNKKLPGLRLPHLLPSLIKPEAELTGNEIRRRNRFYLEIAYPHLCPKSPDLDLEFYGEKN